MQGSAPTPFQGVEALTQTCPASAPSGGPFFADDWAHMAPGEIRQRSARPQTIEPDAGDPQIGLAFDPVFGPGACAQAPGADQPGTASYRLPPAPAPGYTLLGSPTVIARFALPDGNSQVAARLLDVAPDGTETLVARGLWRPTVTPRPKRQVFQLHANGWTFAAGHVPKLELLATDSPYGRTSNGQGSVIVRSLRLRLPVVEQPGVLGHLRQAARPEAGAEGLDLGRRVPAGAQLIGAPWCSGSVRPHACRSATPRAHAGVDGDHPRSCWTCRESGRSSWGGTGTAVKI